MAKKVSAISKTRTTSKAKVATKIVDDRVPKLAERVVPIPSIATFSELPFARIETGNDEHSTMSDATTKKKSKLPGKAAAKKAKLVKSAKAKKRS